MLRSTYRSGVAEIHGGPTTGQLQVKPARTPAQSSSCDTELMAASGPATSTPPSRNTFLGVDPQAAEKATGRHPLRRQDCSAQRCDLAPAERGNEGLPGPVMKSVTRIRAPAPWRPHSTCIVRISIGKELAKESL